jgi:mono/diheme cytochrome c family protein
MKNQPLAIVIGLFLAASAPVRAADATENWNTHCASCHGKDGKGATKAGRMAGVKDLTDATYQGSFTDEKIIESVKKGVKDDKGREKMKPLGDKLSDDEIKALVKVVRGFKK